MTRKNNISCLLIYINLLIPSKFHTFAITIESILQQKKCLQYICVLFIQTLQKSLKNLKTTILNFYKKKSSKNLSSQIQYLVHNVVLKDKLANNTCKIRVGWQQQVAIEVQKQCRIGKKFPPQISESVNIGYHETDISEISKEISKNIGDTNIGIQCFPISRCTITPPQSAWKNTHSHSLGVIQALYRWHTIIWSAKFKPQQSHTPPVLLCDNIRQHMG
eukprot:TRINITY_DN1043_c0_g1_i2.p2 TRINITY_DN1043_c0_g1~~TRINITY_DN1043_c0_g1_i2.p2  ORF type:complete len:219 (-),score=-7.02 TRINITY_DN1043_c0_g1_i2:470-1126(-)